MLFTAAIVLSKFASLGHGLVSMFSFGRKVNQEETLVDQVTTLDKTAVIGALEVVVEKVQPVVVVELAEGSVVAEEEPAQMDELDAFLADDDEDEVVYTRPASRMGWCGEDSDDEDEDDRPATVWVSASAGLTTHFEVSGHQLSPVLFEDQVYLDDEEDEVEDVVVTPARPKRQRFPQFAVFASSIDAVEEENVEVTTGTISIPSSIPTAITVSFTDIATIVVTAEPVAESSVAAAVKDKVAEVEVDIELTSNWTINPTVMLLAIVATSQKGVDVTLWREKLLASKTDEIKQAIEQTRLDRLEEDNHVDTERANFTLAKGVTPLGKIVEVDEPEEEKHNEDEESAGDETDVVLPPLSAIIASTVIASKSEVNTIPFPRFTNDSFDSLLLAEKMDPADEERQAIATNSSVSDTSLASTSPATSIDPSFASSGSDDSIACASVQASSSVPKSVKKRKFGRIARFFSRRL